MAEYHLIDKQTRSGKQLFKCDGCGDETPAPTRNHQCFTNEVLMTALIASLRLQSHYAELLNQHDGGGRRQFPTPADWIARLKETGTIPNV